MSDTMDSMPDPYPTPDYMTEDVRDYPMPDGISNNSGTVIHKRSTPERRPFHPCDDD